MKNSFLLILFSLLCSCSAIPKKFSPDDLLISLNHAPAKAPNMLTSEQVGNDLNYLIYALDRGYVGRDFLPSGAYQNMISRLNSISGAMSPESLRDQIDQVLADVPDSHLHARLNGKWSNYRESKFHTGHIGNNFYQGSADKPWAIEKRKIDNKSVLLISITGFPLHESPVWEGFLDNVERNLPKVDAAIIDLRGNGGGDDTTGLELAWIFHGKDYRQPRSLERERLTPETNAIYANMFAYKLAQNIEQNKKSEGFLVQRYQNRMEKLEDAKKNNTSGYSTDDVSIFKSSRNHKSRPLGFRKPILILMDGRCASSCESTIDAFEFHPSVKRIGENTGGWNHFGDIAPILLSNSQVLIQIATHYGEYFDHRFIEKVGIKPDVVVLSDQDAFDFAIKYLKTLKF